MNAMTFFPPVAITAFALLMPSGATPHPAPAPLTPPTTVVAMPLIQERTDAEPSTEDPEVAYFKPKNVDADMLMSTAQELITHHGVLGELPPSRFPAVAFQVMDTTVIVAALPNLMPRALKLLRELDDQSKHEANAGSGDDDRVTTFQYQLRHLSVPAAEMAVQPFRNHGNHISRMGLTAPTAINIVEETGTVVVRETVAMIAEIRGVLEEIDQPQPQVRLTYHLVRGYSKELMKAKGVAAEDLNKGLPAELIRDLGELLPVEGFRLLSFGVVQGDALAPREFQDEFAEGILQLSMRPTTFDRETGAIGMEQIRFEFVVPGEDRMVTRTFSTSAQLEPGRFTVLGGVGADPVFLVIRLGGV